jgi:DmsE family decaheme c-type cytochrome
VKRFACLLVLFLLVTACSKALTGSRPILPTQDYERLLVGNLDADYIGDDRCLSKCHVHDRLHRDFAASIHGEQLSESGLPLVNCESCHGPGSLAVVNAEQTKKCDSETLLPIHSFPAQAQSMLCLKCHAASSTPVLFNWSASSHAMSGVGCFDCHKLHKGQRQKVSRDEQMDLCLDCHQQVKAEFRQFSRHPLPERKMACTDCHDPHSSMNEASLKGLTLKDTCVRCHMEFQGPFVYEHADVTEDCSNCHSPHGSPNNPLLKVSQPFLCMQCHAGHHGALSPQGSLSNPAMKQAFFSRCTDCHSAIHGTDIPSAHGRGTFIAR